MTPKALEPVERVARAICLARGEDPDELILPETPRFVAYFPEAQAAIAMRPEGDDMRTGVVAAQEGWSHDIHRVALRAGFILCREYMARFVSQGGDASTASSIRANWIPALGEDPGPPRRLRFDECVKSENLEEGPWEAIEPDLCAEAACYALCVASDMKLALAQEIIAAEVSGDATPPETSND